MYEQNSAPMRYYFIYMSRHIFKSLLLMLLLVSNKTHTHARAHACMQARTRARARTHTHTHTSHVLVNTHILNVSCIRLFQELSVNEGVRSRIYLINTILFLF